MGIGCLGFYVFVVWFRVGSVFVLGCSVVLIDWVWGLGLKV